MSYYGRPSGDYKTYGYAGDPGWLSSIWRGVKKIAGPVIGGLVGGPAGAVLGGMVGGAAGTTVGTPPLVPPGSVGGAVSFPGGLQLSGAIVPRAGGAVTPLSIAHGTGACPSGYHLAKDGSGRLVRNRRMNVANPRALRRAMRRTDGFVKLAKRALKGSGYAVRRA